MNNIEFFGKTDVGQVRSNNEDTFMINAGARFCLVADGMGGAAAGEMASQIFAQTAADIFDTVLPASEQTLVDQVQAAFLQANDRILAHAAKFPEHKGMGCTAELLAFTSTGFVVGHMGDSRTYRLRQGNFKQLTKDHSLVQDQIDQGLITEAQARSHRMRNIILRAVGVRPSPALDTLRGPIFSGDLFLLCSDGLTDLIEDQQIVKVLQNNSGLAAKVNRLVEIANSAGGKDNITVVLAKIS
ncbi:MAG: Stp1/IreP family PP2C-type Ser/Thr phosphatase [Desulfatitalea sp.]|nr:Stp1/IreP family PP2C-type Ser/Thr phosphatase [Desulfatitalea sp.]NNK01991.1 Stp1/IreP family PP2C-type Ser/Thr phosphatase [Desulfatitalea sp.]